MKVLLIDDDMDLVQSLKKLIEDEGYTFEFALDGERGSYMGKNFRFDVIILDYSLPIKSGLHVLREIRAVDKKVPIIILSSTFSTVTKIEFLDDGADDYMTKPFAYSELSARMKALLRRPSKICTSIYRVDNLVLDSEKHIVKRGRKGIYLTRKEFLLLELLIKNPGVIISRNEIMEHVWSVDGDPFSNTIEAHVLNIRKKIRIANEKKELIVNVPGRGYKIESKKNNC